MKVLMSSYSRETIGLRLLRYVFGCYFAVSVVVTSIQLFSEYLHVKNNVFQELSNLGETLEGSLARSVWNYNSEQALLTLLGANKISMVAGAKITDLESNVFAVSGDVVNNSSTINFSKKEGEFNQGVIRKISYVNKNKNNTLFEYKFPVYYVEEGDDSRQLVAYCYIYAGYDSVVDRVKYGFFSIIINSLIKTLALWFIFLFFTQRIIAKPLDSLTRATQELDPNNPKELRVDNNELNKILASNHNDELHFLANSFLTMQNAIVDKISLIEHQNINLEQRVRERTATVEEINKELRHLSLHDPLTGLPNRSLFYDRLESLINVADREKFTFAVASVDLRKFKEVNDNFGHQAGDAVLEELSKRMLNAVRNVDTVARMGGDEFAVLLKGADKKSIHKIGEKIMACAYEPIIFNDQSILTGVNVGFSIYPDHGSDAIILFKNADMAMYQTKNNTKGMSLFSPEVNRQLERQDIIAQDLEQAIYKDKMQLYYQPIVCRSTHRVKAVEALLRWSHEELGFIPPDEFVIIAERSNVIKVLTEWVVRKALADGEFFIRQGFDFNISINLSGRLVNDNTFPQRFKKITDASSFPTERITLELTESSMMNNPQQAMLVLNDLKDIGVALAIDDFGTGYSSFSYLSRLPVNELKIDRSFLFDFNKNSEAVVESIIMLAHRLELKVVAEGIENKEMLKIIESMGSDYIQGYHFSRPLPKEELLSWLSKSIENNDIK